MSIGGGGRRAAGNGLLGWQRFEIRLPSRLFRTRHIRAVWSDCLSDGGLLIYLRNSSVRQHPAQRGTTSRDDAAVPPACPPLPPTATADAIKLSFY